MSHHEGNIGIYWRDFAPSWPAVKEIFYGGSPSMSRQGLLCVSTMLLNHAAGTWGDAAIAGMSIVGRITMLVMAVVIGLGQGFQPLCGFCYGAKLYSRLKRAWWFTTIVGTVFLLAVSGLGWLFSSELIALFRDDMEVVAVGVVALRWQLLTLPLCATMMSSNMLTQTCRKPWRANLLAASQWSLLHPQHPRPPLLAGTDGRGGLSERKRPVCLHRHRSGHGLYLPRTAGLVLGILVGTHVSLSVFAHVIDGYQIAASYYSSSSH